MSWSSLEHKNDLAKVDKTEMYGFRGATLIAFYALESRGQPQTNKGCIRGQFRNSKSGAARDRPRSRLTAWF